jgi:hypothetical protein
MCEGNTMSNDPIADAMIGRGDQERIRQAYARIEYAGALIAATTPMLQLHRPSLLTALYASRSQSFEGHPVALEEGDQVYGGEAESDQTPQLAK